MMIEILICFSFMAVLFAIIQWLRVVKFKLIARRIKDIIATSGYSENHEYTPAEGLLEIDENLKEF